LSKSDKFTEEDRQIGVCPICKGQVVSNYFYKMEDADTKDISIWMKCRCGVVWNTEIPNDATNIFDKKYVKILMEDSQKHIDASMYAPRVFAPIIEESTYGRKMLEVGYCTPFVMQAMSTRGWISFGIDISKDAPTNERMIQGDFETYTFPKDLRFNLVWMGHVLENFEDPIGALEHAYEILTEDGLIFISTPDTDFIYTNDKTGFCHWRGKENYIMWSRPTLENKLREMGFDILVSKRNYEKRFTNWDNMFIVAQKKVY